MNDVSQYQLGFGKGRYGRGRERGMVVPNEVVISNTIELPVTLNCTTTANSEVLFERQICIQTRTSI